MKREDVFARDGYRCVYCGLVLDAASLTVDHVQPRLHLGDQSGGNLVTACQACNTRKGHQRLAVFLAADVGRRDNFFRYATAVWPRHLRAVRDELQRADLPQTTGRR
jgi:5-methylcytosine-specific restriction endonuclease McrA